MDIFAAVRLLHDVVDVGDGGRDQEGKDERDDIVLANPNVDVNRVEDSEEGEAPADTVDDGALSGGEELVDHCTAEQEVDEGPDGECPGGGGDVGIFSMAIDVRGPGESVHVGA